jgi:integrase
MRRVRAGSLPDGLEALLEPAGAFPRPGPSRARGNGRLWPRRREVDHKGDRVQGTKTGERREVPITPRLAELLAKRRFLGADAFVFGKADGTPLAPNSLRKPFSTLKLIAYGRKAGYQRKDGTTNGRWFDESTRQALKQVNLDWHDLRHEGASRYGESGKLTLRELMELLGHRRPETTMRYWQLGQSGFRDSVHGAAAVIQQQREARVAARKLKAEVS